MDKTIHWLADRFDNMSLLTKASAVISFNLMSIKGLFVVIGWFTK